VTAGLAGVRAGDSDAVFRQGLNLPLGEEKGERKRKGAVSESAQVHTNVRRLSCVT
jgi:hypothetical protein